MYVQLVLKGMPGFEPDSVRRVFTEGIQAQAIQNAPGTPLVVLCEMLTLDNLYRHIRNYVAAGATSAFISLTAGARGLERVGSEFRAYRAWDQASGFATKFGRTNGAIVEAWVPCLGSPAVHLPGVAEDTRNLAEYPTYNPFWKQGEVTAKLLVPPTQILRAVCVDSQGQPTGAPIANPRAEGPESIANLRRYT